MVVKLKHLTYSPMASTSFPPGIPLPVEAANKLNLSVNLYSFAAGHFSGTYRVDAQTVANGTINPISCLEEGCVDGVVLRGNFSEFSVPDDICSNTSAPWNALASEIEYVIEECANGTRQVSVFDTACCVCQQSLLRNRNKHYPFTATPHLDS